MIKESRKYEELQRVLEELDALRLQPVNDVRELELRMVKINQEYLRRDIRHYSAECIHDLKQKRWAMMRDSFEWTDENVKLLEAANERLKEAMLDMRRQTIEVYEAIHGWCTSDKDLYVEGSLWVDEMTFEGWEDDEDMQDGLFDVMTSRDVGNFYVNSVGQRFELRHDEMKTNTQKDCETEDELLYLSYSDDSVDNWNEMMPPDKTAHLHLVYDVHNLYEHCHWSLQDLLGIRSYRTKIEIDYSPRFKENV